MKKKVRMMKCIESTQVTRAIRLAIITSRFNTSVTQKLFEGAKARLNYHGIDEACVTAIWVPGAIEIPLVASTLAKQGNVDAIVCLGAVIRGETSHYDYVCSQVSEGCAKVSDRFGLPVIFGVLTTENAAQAFARCGGAHGHVGKSSVDSALAMISVLDQLG